MGVDAVMYLGVPVNVEFDAARLSWELAAAFGSWNFTSPDGDDDHVTALVKVDGAVEHMPGLQAWQLCIYERYFGRNYIRGNIVLILAMGRFLRTKVPGADVWYGSDSTEYLQRMTPELEAELWDIFCTDGRYFVLQMSTMKGARPCDYCSQPISGDKCPGCGHHRWPGAPKYRDDRQSLARIAALAASDEPKAKDRIFRIAS